MIYTEMTSKNAAAIEVELADLQHNKDTSRLGKTDKKTLERVEKYGKAVKLLEG
jgi:hypothetical protein